MMSLLTPLVLFTACRDASDDTASDAAVNLTRLRAEGTDIVDEDGQTVAFRGVALGGWNFLETWIPLMAYTEHARAVQLADEQGIGTEVRAAIVDIGPGEGAEWRSSLAAALSTSLTEEAISALIGSLESYSLLWDDSDLALRQVLETRFGADARDELLDIYQRAWFTEADVAWLAEEGFNVVRIPLGYRGLTTHMVGEEITELSYNELAFARIDEVLDWCEQYGLYAVIDLQESPGGHNDYSGVGTLYEDPQMQALTVALWEELSRRYIDRDVVAAYSLLAEPMAAPSVEARDEMYDQIVQAIRARGDDHLLVLHDGFQGMASFPQPEEKGWDNVVYSTHIFEWGADSLELYQAYIVFLESTITLAQDTHQVPYYVGSFSTFLDQDWAYEAAGEMRRLFEESGWGWTLWTYKRLDDPVDAELFGDSSAWGVRGGVPAGFSRPDPQRQSLEELQAAYAGYAQVETPANEALLQALLGE